MQERVLYKEIKGSKQNLEARILCGNSQELLANWKERFDLIITSPPYADARKRHYESIHPDRYVDWFLQFHEPFFHALKPSGSLIINIKDSVIDGVRHRYVWHLIDALSDRGWLAIDDYIWHKTNPMPGSWPNRLRDGWEYCFHLAKQRKPFFNPDAVKQPIGDWTKSRLRNLGENDSSRHNSQNRSGFGRDISRWVGKKTVLPSNVLRLPVVGKNKQHPAVFPLDLPLFFIKLLSPQHGLVLDPFAGSGTTGIAALQQNRNVVLIDNNELYCQIAKNRLEKEVGATSHLTTTSSFYTSPELYQAQLLDGTPDQNLYQPQNK